MRFGKYQYPCVEDLEYKQMREQTTIVENGGKKVNPLPHRDTL